MSGETDPNTHVYNLANSKRFVLRDQKFAFAKLMNAENHSIRQILRQLLSKPETA